MLISWQHMQRLMRRPAPVGVSPVVFRNWLLGRYLARKRKEAPDAAAWLKAAQAALEGTPLRGMAVILWRFYCAYPYQRQLSARLYWAHYRALLAVPNVAERVFYERCCLVAHWTAGQLERQIRSQWLWRRQSGGTTAPLLSSAEAAIALPNPLVLDFNIRSVKVHNERQLEALLLDQLSVLLLELGPGFSFVARQQRLTTFSGKHFSIDLVFYHYHWRRFVLFELKNGPLNAAAIGQLETYVQLFDDLWKSATDQPTLGVILCRKIDPALLRYSALHQHPQLRAIEFKMKNEK